MRYVHHLIDCCICDVRKFFISRVTFNTHIYMIIYVYYYTLFFNKIKKILNYIFHFENNFIKNNSVNLFFICIKYKEKKN